MANRWIRNQPRKSVNLNLEYLRVCVNALDHLKNMIKVRNVNEPLPSLINTERGLSLGAGLIVD